MDFLGWRYCPYCGGKWDRPDEQLAKGVIVCGACGCSFVDYAAKNDRLLQTLLELWDGILLRRKEAAIEQDNYEAGGHDWWMQEQKRRVLLPFLAVLDRCFRREKVYPRRHR